MAQIKGTVERVACKAINTKYGEKNNIGLVVKGDWYNFLHDKKPEDLGVEQGVAVSFSYNTDDYGNKLQPKTLKVAKGQGKNQASGSGGNQTAGIACGHAVTNGVQLAVAEGNTDARSVYEKAVEVLSISTRLQGQYDDIVEAAKNGKKPAASEPEPAPEPEPEPEQEEDFDDEEFDDSLPF